MLKKSLFLLVLLTSILGGVLTSCSNDDDDEDSDVTWTFSNGDNYFTFTGKESSIATSGTWTLYLSTFDHSSLWTPTTYSVASETTTISIDDTDTTVYAVTLTYTLVSSGSDASMTGYLSTDKKTLYYGHSSYTAYTRS